MTRDKNSAAARELRYNTPSSATRNLARTNHRARREDEGADLLYDEYDRLDGSGLPDAEGRGDEVAVTPRGLKAMTAD